MIYNNIDLHGINEVIPCAGGVCSRRIPDAVSKSINTSAQGHAKSNTGTEIRFVPEDDEVRLTLSTFNEGERNTAILYYGSVQAGWETLNVVIDHAAKEFVFKPSVRLADLERIRVKDGMPFSPRVIRIMLSGSSIVIGNIIGKVRPPKADEVPKIKGLFYGSSITHGSLACAPNLFWTRRTAEKLGCDSENYGLAGACQMEHELADWFSSRSDWDFMNLELGINVFGKFDNDTFRERVRYMINTIHNAHPDKYIFCIDMFYFNSDFHGNESTDVYRGIVADEVVKINSEYVIHFDGKKLLTDTTYLSEDGCHPNIDGVIEIADNLSAAMNPYIAKITK